MSILGTKPHPTNFCGGNFSDWLEVNLLPECNGKCSWCIERAGFHPRYRASWGTIGQAVIDSGKQNIILLGGEPTLYKNLKNLIRMLARAKRNVYVTTNGYLLRQALDSLDGVTGVNISVHHYDLNKNASIVGLKLKQQEISYCINQIRGSGAEVRLNCNLINGYIDSKLEVERYLEFVNNLGAQSVRFAELKMSGNFVDLTSIFGYKYGLTDDPFVHGCNHNTIINGISVNLRQMCGLQTNYRKVPVNPIQCGAKQVLYYDGIMYQGWQSSNNLDKIALIGLLSDLAAGNRTIGEVERYLK